jgi:hypothetical protein
MIDPFSNCWRELLWFVCLTLAITWPHGVLVEEDSFMAAAQVHGGVRQM